MARPRAAPAAQLSETWVAENEAMSRGGPTNPMPGQHMRFVRYVSTRDGWTPEIVRGEIEDRTDAGWRVRVIDDVRELPETEWSIYYP